MGMIMMINNLSLTAKKCMDTISKNIGTVELEAFIYYVRSQNFDYTKWQREHFDSMTPDEINRLMTEYSSTHEFCGNKAEII